MATKTKKRATAKRTVGGVVDDVLKQRAQALKARARALEELPATRAMPTMKATPHTALVAAATGTKGWLIAEGDSWFDYPGTDILNALHQSAYDVESVARAGDRVEMMAFGRGQLEKFAAAVEKVISSGQTPRAILLSGGGNDIAGTEFGFLINHAGSPKQGFNDSVVRGVIDERVRDAYVWIIRTITDLCQKMLKQKVRIIVHGYGYAIPDGDGVLGGWGPLPGPWLRPGFIEKGFNNLAENTAMMQTLMDRFNAMVKGVAAEFAHVRYVDLRNVLPATKSLWANELHPKEAGFKLAAKEFEKAIEGA
ncbi:MAG TPA: SGNH/GDSL hydrolase family protein [Thermoanaerobaculia bacterium]|nr:SGNH/GDSL hydrolase family protein [Thermoanaerobaculia bacterium]